MEALKDNTYKRERSFNKVDSDVNDSSKRYYYTRVIYLTGIEQPTKDIVVDFEGYEGLEEDFHKSNILKGDSISLRSLKMMDESMKNFEKGIVSEPIDFDELDELLDD